MSMSGFTLQSAERRYPHAMTTSKRVLPVAAALALGLAASGCGFQSIPQSENGVSAAWGEVQNQYQRRADLVPNLVETVKGAAQFEQQTLQQMIEARAQATSIKLEAQA